MSTTGRNTDATPKILPVSFHRSGKCSSETGEAALKDILQYFMIRRSGFTRDYDFVCENYFFHKHVSAWQYKCKTSVIIFGDTNYVTVKTTSNIILKA